MQCNLLHCVKICIRKYENYYKHMTFLHTKMTIFQLSHNLICDRNVEK